MARSGWPPRYGFTPRTRERGRTEAIAHEQLRFAPPGNRLGVGEVERGQTEPVADEVDRAVELGGGLAARDPVEQLVGVGVRADVDESSRAGVAERGPREGAPAAGEIPLLLDERGREVERRGHAVPGEDRDRHLGEVGGPVVEGDHDRRGSRVRRRELLERGAERQRASRRRDGRDLFLEPRGVEIDLERGTAADPVVEQDDDARYVGAPAVGRGRRRLHAAPEDGASAWHSPRTPTTAAAGAPGRPRRSHAPCASRGTGERTARGARASVVGPGARSSRTPGT